MSGEHHPGGDSLDKEREELLALLAAEDAAAEVEPPKIPRRDPTQPPPLGFAQEQLWFLHQFDPGIRSYHILISLRLSGRLDGAALESSLNEVIRRHEALRTVFRSRGGRPVQLIQPALVVPLAVRLMPAGGAEERENTLKRLLEEDADRPFDLEQGPLVRAALIRIADEDHAFQIVSHHIVVDGWSLGVLMREISELYRSRVEGTVAALPELPLQPGDHAAWEHEQARSGALASHLSFWREELAGDLPVLELPSDRPRPPRQSFQGGTHPWSLPRDTFAAFKQLCQRERVTSFMGLLAVFNVLLHRLSRSTDVLVGCASAGRHHPGLENLVGMFVNTVVLRTRFDDDPTFVNLLRRVRDTSLRAFEHQDLPFERIVQELQPHRSNSHNPIFQVGFSHLSTSAQDLSLPGIVTRSIPIGIKGSKFDVTFGMWEKGDGLEGWLEYNTDIFDGTTIARMAVHFANLLRGVVASPESRVSELPLLDAEERRKLVEELNRTGREYASGLRMQDLFEEQVRKTPGACALVYCGPDGTGAAERWSYEKLNRRANQLADRLRQEGVGPDVLVGVCHERSPELVVCLLAVLKAGGAYVPIDPNYPQQRVAFMLEDTGAPVLLTQKSLVGRLPSGVSRAICLDEEGTAKDLSARPEGNPVAGKKETKETDLAYVIFTSGSTGRPKGVALEHRNAVKFIQWAKEVFPAEELSRVLFSTSVCFDLSVYEVFVTLSSGGAIVLAENALALPTLSAREEITLINTVPSAAAELVRLKAIPGSVKVVNLAGEALSVELVKELYGIGTLKKVYDLYGPSEDTTYSTYTLRRADGPATIGRPIANTQAYVMDGHRQLVPFGVPGELYLGGDGLARGYLNRPELTAERFVENPVEGAPSRRLYRTGDLVRYLADGNLEYLGRMDQQVKIRGFRIELGEIESAIRNLAGVKDCVVVAREDKQGDPQIVAYLVTVPGSGEMASSNIRTHLKSTLPDYMIPAAYVTLPSLPLTPNGKLDRKALPAPEPGSESRPGAAAVGKRAPRNEQESVILGVWKEVLGLAEIGVDEDFFELGGHSLRATQVISRLSEALQLKVSLRALFDSPTVAGLSIAIDEAREKKIRQRRG